MVDYVIYGKIIIDDIQLRNGEIRRNILGGGGPQGVFGARLWDSSVGLLTRSGADIDPKIQADLEAIRVDLSGWVKYDDLPTPHGLMAYDENEYVIGGINFEKRKEAFMRKMGIMLSRAIAVPDSYRTPRVIHLITEYAHEPMVETALRMKEQGTLFSLEPLIDYHDWTNREDMTACLTDVDIVTPDWPSASGIAHSDDPRQVLTYWSKLGAGMVAIRHGARGSYVWDRQYDKMWHIPIFKVETVDPTGCGNSYGGGLCVGWDKHRDARLAGCCATVSASFLAGSVGVPKMTKALEQEAQQRLEALLSLVKPL